MRWTSAHGMVNVKNITQHTTTDGVVTTTVMLGVVNDQGNDNGVYALRLIHSTGAPNSYDSMKDCVAAAMTAMRGQYGVVKDNSEQQGEDTWRTWFNMAVGLTWSPGTRAILYRMNEVSGLPALIDCYAQNVPVPAAGTLNGNYTEAQRCYQYILDRKFAQQGMAPPHHAFSQYGVTSATGGGGTPFVHGINVPLVSTDHMKHGDAEELHWVNAAMHMVLPRTTYSFTPKTSLPGVQGIIPRALEARRPTAPRTTSVATQVMAPYPVQWRTSEAALAQAMQVATVKLVGEQNYAKYFGPPGDAMSVAMGAAYFVVRPHTNQMHLKAMYSQDDRVMPLDSATAFSRDITATGVRNRYLQALMVLGAG